MKMKKGFTLVEIMVVVAIIVLLSAIAIPNLLRARINANESAAIVGLRAVSNAAQSYRVPNPRYPASLAALSAATPPYIDSTLGAGLKQGYNYILAGTTNRFTATAKPQVWGKTGTRNFFVDQTGVIRYNTVTFPDPGPTSSAVE